MPESHEVPPTVGPAATDPHATRNEGLPSEPTPFAEVSPESVVPDTLADQPLAQPPVPPPSVELAGRYEVLGEIGRGGMGAVLRGRDPVLGRDLAIKILLQEVAGRPDVAQRFREEAQVGGQLQHPGVVPVYELGLSADGQPYFTM